MFIRTEHISVTSDDIAEDDETKQKRELEDSFTDIIQLFKFVFNDIGDSNLSPRIEEDERLISISNYQKCYSCWLNPYLKILVKILLRQMWMIPTMKATILAYPRLTIVLVSITTFDWLQTTNQSYGISLKMGKVDLVVIDIKVFVAKKDATMKHSKTHSMRHLITD